MQRPHRAVAAMTALIATAVLLTTNVLAQSTKTSSAYLSSYSCSAVAKGTLTFECGGACASYQPCIAATSASSGCQCLTVDTSAPSSYNTFKLLIPFDSATNASLNTAKLVPSLKRAGTWDLNSVPWVSNDVVTKIAPLNLLSTTTDVWIIGGDSLGASSKGYMATVSIDPKFLAKQTQVTYLILVNMDLASTVDSIVTNLPRTMKILSIFNTGLTAFPSAITSLTSLINLNLAFNNIERVTTEHEIPGLTTLSIHTNKIKTFSAVYPKLTELYLSGNKLTSVPEVIGNHSLLTTLTLFDNLITTFDQFSAPSSLEMLWLSNNTLSSFDAYLPSLTVLALNGNRLATFPPAIFSFRSLRDLYIYGNPLMQNVAFTNEQASFLNGLTTFSIDRSSLKTDCAANQQYELKSTKVTVCISNGKDLVIIEGQRIVAPAPTSSPTPSPAPTSSAGITDPEPSSHTAPIVGGTAGALLLLILVVIVVVRRRHKSANKPVGNEPDASDNFTAVSSEATLQGASNVSAGELPLWMDADLRSLKMDSDDIEDIRKLGSGAFADVWLVKFRGAELLASKRLRTRQVDRKRSQDFIDEIKLVAKLNHPRVVELKGVAWIRELDLQALFEYMDGGDLRVYLMNPNVPVRWSAEKMQIAVDVIEALVYVHSFSPPLVHRDLKSRNVLLSSGESSDNSSGSYSGVRAKLTDFGVARYRSQDNTMTAGVGTGRWLAPEVISGNDDYGSAADIFSFGVVLSELDSHQLPYADVRGRNGNPLSDVALLQRVASGELVPNMSASCPPKIAELMRLCCALQPADRPTAPEVAYALRRLQKESR